MADATPVKFPPAVDPLEPRCATMTYEESMAWDRFAAAALHALIRAGFDHSPKEFAASAAQFADAMMRERQRRLVAPAVTTIYPRGDQPAPDRRA